MAGRNVWLRLLRTVKPCGPGTRCWCQVGGGFASPTASGGYGLDPVRSPVFLLCKRSVGDRARKARSLTQRVAIGVPFLATRDHDVENADQLAHAGDQRHLLFFSLGNQAVVDGLHDWIVSSRRHKK